MGFIGIIVMLENLGHYQRKDIEPFPAAVIGLISTLKKPPLKITWENIISFLPIQIPIVV